MQAKLLPLIVTVVALATATTDAMAQEAQRHAYETPPGVELSVTAGEIVYVSGSYALSEAMTLSQDISSTMPGSMFIPFAFSIRAGTYFQAKADDDWTWFCAPLDYASASFPGLGSVVAQGDCIGVRRSNQDGRLQWVVDNSIYNGMHAVWSRNVRPEELRQISFSKTKRVADAEVEQVVTFDGYYGGLLNFTFTEGARHRDMKFDYDGKSEKMIGMLGKKMVVLNADSVELRYKWVGTDKR